MNTCGAERVREEGELRVPVALALPSPGKVQPRWARDRKNVNFIPCHSTLAAAW